MIAMLRLGLPIGLLAAVLWCAGMAGCSGGTDEPDGAAWDAGDGGDTDGDDGGGAGDDDGGAGDDDGGAGDDDGGAGDDGGGAGDDGGEVQIELALEPVEGWQRGPVRLPFVVFGPAGRTADVSLAYSTDGQAFEPATALASTEHESRDLPLSPDGAAGRFVWDSKRNVPSDEPAVFVRATVRVDGVVEAADEAGPFDLHNALDFDRALVVPHPYVTDAGGGAVPGTYASLLLLRADGTVDDTGQDIDCGEGPALSAFSADGRFGVVLGEGYGHNRHTLAAFQVDRDGNVSRLGEAIDLYALGLSASDLVPAPDGSGIWLVHYTGEGGLFFLSFEHGAPALATGPGGGHHLMEITLPTAMAVLPDNRRAILSGGALAIDDPPYDVTLVDLQDGAVLDQAVLGLEALSDRVAVSSDGSLALMPSPSWSGNSRLWAVSIDGDRIGTGLAVDVPAPAWVYLHPDSTSALLTSWDADSVTVLDVSVQPPAVTQTIAPVGLADHLDCVDEGSLAGLCLVSSISASTGVSSLVPIRLEPDASASRGASFDFGNGYDSITSGPAIQP